MSRLEPESQGRGVGLTVAGSATWGQTPSRVCAQLPATGRPGLFCGKIRPLHFMRSLQKPYRLHCLTAQHVIALLGEMSAKALKGGKT